MTFLDQSGTWSWISYQLLVDVALWLQPFWGWDFCPWPSSCLHASERSWFTFREFGCSFLQWKRRSPRSTSLKNLWCDSVIHLNFAQICYEETGIVFWYDLFLCKVVWISKFCGASPRSFPYLPTWRLAQYQTLKPCLGVACHSKLLHLQGLLAACSLCAWNHGGANRRICFFVGVLVCFFELVLVKKDSECKNIYSAQQS